MHSLDFSPSNKSMEGDPAWLIRSLQTLSSAQNLLGGPTVAAGLTPL